MRFLTLCTSHKNRKISHLTFDAWSEIRQTVLNRQSNSEILKGGYDFLLESYLELYKIVLGKCKLNSLTLVSASEARMVKIHNVETGEDEDFDEDDTQIDLKKQNFSIREYRTLAEDVFYDCYQMMSQLRGDEGIKVLFSLVAPILSPDFIVNNNINLNAADQRADYVLNCEAVIFSVKFMLDNLDEDFPNPYILEMMRNMINLPREDILSRGILNFFAEGSPQLKNIPEVTANLFDFCLQSLLNPVLVGSAAKVI